MRRESCGDVRPRVRAFQKQDFVRPHLRNIVPAMVWAEAYIVSLADTIRINEVGGNKTVRADGGRVANRERSVVYRMLDRPPEVDFLNPVFQKFFGLVGQKGAHPLRR